MSPPRHPRTLAVLLAAVVAGLGLLWGGSAPSLGSNGATPPASPVASPVTSPTALPWPAAASVARAVTIHLTDGGFAPSYIESTNGHDLTVTLINEGTRAHGFVVDRLGIAVRLDPGESSTIVIHQPPLGDFTIVSDAPGDSEMQGTLTFYI